MLHFSKLKIFSILAVILIGVLFSLPNVLSPAARAETPEAFLPHSTLNLGLDLQGGAHMLLAVDLKDGIQKTLKSERDGIRDALREEARIRANMKIENDAIYISFKSAADEETGAPIIQAQSQNVDERSIGGGGKTLVIEKVGDLRYKVTISEEYIEFISANTIDQSIQVLAQKD